MRVQWVGKWIGYAAGQNGQDHTSARLDRTRAIPAVVSALLGALILADGVRLALDLHQVSRPLELPKIKRPWMLLPPRRPDAQAVAQAHLFGSRPGEVQGSDEVVTGPPPPLVLTGVVAFSDPTRGAAIIGSDHGTRLVQAGAEMPEGYLMREVYPDHVVLERGSERQIVVLKKLPGAGGGAGLLALMPPERQSTGLSGDEPQAVSRNPRDFTTARSWFNGFLARQAPSDDGQFHGFALHPMPRYKRQYGVRDGDVLTAIEGVPLGDPDSAARVLQQVHGSKVSVTIERAGVAQQMTLDIGS